MSSIGATASLAAKGNAWGRFMSGADSNKDGAISLTELVAVSSEAAANTVLARNDANDDGLLTADELPKGVFSPTDFATLLDGKANRTPGARQRSGVDTSSLMALFKSADTDGNGALSSDEWATQWAQRSEKIAESRSRSTATATTAGARGAAGTPVEDIDTVRQAVFATVASNTAQATSSDLSAGDPEVRDIAGSAMSAAFLTRLLMSLEGDWSF